MEPVQARTLDPRNTYIYRTYETRYTVAVMGAHSYDYRLFTVETKDGLTVKVTADWFSLKVGDEWLNFPREYQSTILDAFASKEARLITIGGKQLLSSDTIPAFMPWHPALAKQPWHLMPVGGYQIKSYNVYVLPDTINTGDVSVDKDLYKKFYEGNEMRRVAFTLAEIHALKDTIGST